MQKSVYLYQLVFDRLISKDAKDLVAVQFDFFCSLLFRKTVRILILSFNQVTTAIAEC